MALGAMTCLLLVLDVTEDTAIHESLFSPHLAPQENVQSPVIALTAHEPGAGSPLETDSIFAWHKRAVATKKGAAEAHQQAKELVTKAMLEVEQKVVSPHQAVSEAVLKMWPKGTELPQKQPVGRMNHLAHSHRAHRSLAQPPVSGQVDFASFLEHNFPSPAIDLSAVKASGSWDPSESKKHAPQRTSYGKFKPAGRLKMQLEKQHFVARTPNKSRRKLKVKNPASYLPKMAQLRETKTAQFTQDRSLNELHLKQTRQRSLKVAHQLNLRNLHKEKQFLGSAVLTTTQATLHHTLGEGNKMHALQNLDFFSHITPSTSARDALQVQKLSNLHSLTSKARKKENTAAVVQKSAGITNAESFVHQQVGQKNKAAARLRQNKQTLQPVSPNTHLTADVQIKSAVSTKELEVKKQMLKQELRKSLQTAKQMRFKNQEIGKAAKVLAESTPAKELRAKRQKLMMELHSSFESAKQLKAMNRNIQETIKPPHSTLQERKMAQNRGLTKPRTLTSYTIKHTSQKVPAASAAAAQVQVNAKSHTVSLPTHVRAHVPDPESQKLIRTQRQVDGRKPPPTTHSQIQVSNPNRQKLMLALKTSFRMSKVLKQKNQEEQRILREHSRYTSKSQARLKANSNMKHSDQKGEHKNVPTSKSKSLGQIDKHKPYATIQTTAATVTSGKKIMTLKGTARNRMKTKSQHLLPAQTIAPPAMKIQQLRHLNVANDNAVGTKDSLTAVHDAGLNEMHHYLRHLGYSKAEIAAAAAMASKGRSPMNKRLNKASASISSLPKNVNILHSHPHKEPKESVMLKAELRLLKQKLAVKAEHLRAQIQGNRVQTTDQPNRVLTVKPHQVVPVQTPADTHKHGLTDEFQPSFHPAQKAARRRLPAQKRAFSKKLQEKQSVQQLSPTVMHSLNRNQLKKLARLADAELQRRMPTHASAQKESRQLSDHLTHLRARLATLEFQLKYAKRQPLRQHLQDSASGAGGHTVKQMANALEQALEKTSAADLGKISTQDVNLLFESSAQTGSHNATKSPLISPTTTMEKTMEEAIEQELRKAFGKVG